MEHVIVCEQNTVQFSILIWYQCVYCIYRPNLLMIHSNNYSHLEKKAYHYSHVNFPTTVYPHFSTNLIFVEKPNQVTPSSLCNPFFIYAHEMIYDTFQDLTQLAIHNYITCLHSRY